MDRRGKITVALVGLLALGAVPVLADTVYMQQLGGNRGASSTGIVQQGDSSGAFVEQLPPDARPRPPAAPAQAPAFAAVELLDQTLEAPPIVDEALAVTEHEPGTKPGLPYVGVGANAVFASGAGAEMLPTVGKGLVN